MIKKSILLMAGLVMFGLASVAFANWDRILIGGGSMKRYLFDVNNDGHVDSLTVARWYKNPGTGAGNWQAIWTGWCEEKWNGSYQVGHPNMNKFVDGVRVGDINGDGLPDMVVGTYGDDYLQGVPVPEHMQDSIYVAINPGNEGEWSFYYIGTLPASDDGVETVAIGDMNKDGYPDILAGGECHKVYWFVNPGYMTDNWAHYVLYESYWDIEGMVIRDFNNDTYLDVAIVTCSWSGLGGSVNVLINPQAEQGNWTSIVVDEEKCSCIESISAGDINDDGWNDIVLTNSQGYVSSCIFWYENPQGAGSWTRRVIDTVGGSLEGSPPEVADIDLDGKPDVICYRSASGATYWYKNPGGGSNWLKTKIYGANIRYYAVGDVDNDGDTDIIYGGYWYVNPVHPFEDDVEDTAWSESYWTADGLWHITERRSNSGTHSWWYGQEATGNYDTGSANSGSIVSQDIDLTDATSATLIYWTYWETEDYANYDEKRVEVSVNGGPWTLLEQLPAGSGSGTRIVDIPVGAPVKIRFYFNTIDHLYNDYEGWFIDDIKVEVHQGRGPNITTTSLPDGTVSIAYSQTLTATGGTTPYTWIISSGSLPAGLSLNSSTGEISGTPTSTGTSNFTVKVVDSSLPQMCDTQPLSITIDEAPEGLCDNVEDPLWSESYWTADGLWHITERRSNSGTHSWWYGQEATGNYDTGSTNSGSIVSRDIDLTDATSATLTYWTYWETEDYANYDKKRVEVSVNGGPWTLLEELPAGSGSGTRIVDLPVGASVKIRFYFDTVDKYNNSYEGWFIDDIFVLAEKEK